MGKKFNSRMVTALKILSSGRKVHGSEFYGVGRMTFGELIDNGWATEPYDNLYAFQITEAGRAAHEAAIASGVPPIDRPDDFEWVEMEPGTPGKGRRLNASGVIEEFTWTPETHSTMSFSQMRARVDDF